MTSYDYCTADVFTDHVFGGNPLAVLLDARGIDDRGMQSIAREFNYSETTFVLPPTDPRCTARVRIFTPGGELPFAGHPTVGTAFVLASLGLIDAGTSDIVFEETIGSVPVRIDRSTDGRVSRCTLIAAQQPEFLAAIDDRAATAAMLGLDAAAVSSTPEIWSCGVPFLVVPLRHVDALARARLDLERWRTMLVDAVTQKVYPIAPAGDASWRVRMFAPSLGVAEDPATGSAAASLAGWLARHVSGDEGTHVWQILQGQEIGRPSEITLAYEQLGTMARTVCVGGSAVLVARGTLMV